MKKILLFILLIQAAAFAQPVEFFGDSTGVNENRTPAADTALVYSSPGRDFLFFQNANFVRYIVGSFTDCPVRTLPVSISTGSCPDGNYDQVHWFDCNTDIIDLTALGPLDSVKFYLSPGASQFNYLIVSSPGEDCNIDFGLAFRADRFEGTFSIENNVEYIQNGTMPTAADSLMWAVVVQQSLNKRQGASLPYQEDVTSLTADQLIANQNADGSYAAYLPGGFSPVDDNSDGRDLDDFNYEIENNFRSFGWVVAREFYLTGQFQYFQSVMLAIQGVATRCDLGDCKGTKLSWTPVKVWGPEAYAHALALIAPGWVRWRDTTINNGETVDDIMRRSLRHYGGLDQNWNATLISVADTNMTGEIDNVVGANAAQNEASQAQIAASVIYAKGNNSLMQKTYGKLFGPLGAYGFGWGLTYESTTNQYNDFVGFGPGGAFLAHNEAGAQSQLLKYLPTLVTNSVRSFEIFNAKPDLYPIQEFILERLTVSLENASFDATSRAKGTGFRAGRGYLNQKFNGSGRLGGDIEDILEVAPFTANQRARLEAIAFYCLGVNRLPGQQTVRYTWSSGKLLSVGGNLSGSTPVTHYYSGVTAGRGRFPDQFGPAVSYVEQEAAGERNFNNATASFFYNESGILSWGPRDSRDMEGLISNWAYSGPDGTMVPNTQVGIPLQANSNNTTSLNVEHAGATLDSTYGCVGWRKQRLLYDPVDVYRFRAEIQNIRTANTGLSDWMGMSVDLYGDATAESSPAGADIKLNTVEWIPDDTLYIDLNGSPFKYVLGSGNPAPATVTDYSHWRPTRPGSAYTRGSGVILLGTWDLSWDNVDGRYRVMADLGETPNGVDAIRIRLWNCTQADVERVKDSLSLFLNFTNTIQTQAVTWVPDSIHMASMYYEDGMTEAFGDTLESTEPVAVVMRKEGSTYKTAYGWGRWYDAPAASITVGANFSMNGAAPVFSEFWKDVIPVDRISPAFSRPAGLYYGGGTEYTTLDAGASPAAPDTFPPQIPANLLVTTNRGTATITWNASANTDFYTLNIDSAGTELFFDNEFTGTEYVLTGLLTAPAYRARVRARNEFGNSSYASFVFPIDTISSDTLSPPALSSTVLSASSARVEFTSVADAIGYVFVLDSAGIQVRYDSLVEDEFIVYQGLTFSTEYSSRVKAVNADTISGEFSAPEVFTTSGEISAPLPPSVSFTVTDSSATFTWLSDPNVDFYVLSLDSSNVGLNFFTNYQDTFYVFEGLAPNGTYRGRVRAHNSAGNSGYASQTFTTADQPGPDPEPILSAPSNIEFFQVGDTSAEVSWDAVGPAIGYVAILDSAGIQVRYDSLVTGASISYQGLSPNTVYDFRLATVNADGVRGASSGNIPFVTDEPAPIVPDPVASRVQIILIVNGRVVGKPYKVIWTDTPYRMLEIKVFSSNTLFPNPGQIINLSDVPGTLRSKIQILAPNQ